MIKLDDYNPMGTDGFEFLEFSSPEPDILTKQFQQLGFQIVAKHRSKDVTLFRQGTIRFILNKEPQTLAATFAEEHGAGCCAMAFRVKDANAALAHAISQGAEVLHIHHEQQECEIPAIKGIGGSLIYLLDESLLHSVYETDFIHVENQAAAQDCGLTYIDHLTHNVKRGQMDDWYDFYKRIFNFQEIRFFDIQGQMTGLISRALTSPCGKIRIPLNEATDDKSQIEEFLREFHGEGIQHIALGTDNIYQSVEALAANKITFLDVPDTYYETVNARVPGHQENLAQMQRDKILIDGNATTDDGLLLQIFTENMLGPVFFEIIQRKGNDGFGEGNFKALFEAIERDQMQRGVL